MAWSGKSLSLMLILSVTESENIRETESSAKTNEQIWCVLCRMDVCVWLIVDLWEVFLFKLQFAWTMSCAGYTPAGGLMCEQNNSLRINCVSHFYHVNVRCLLYLEGLRKHDHEVTNLNNIRQAENAKHPHAIIQCLWSMNEFLIMTMVFYPLWRSRLFGAVVKFLCYSCVYVNYSEVSCL